MWWQRARQAWEHLNRRTARASERFFRGSDILDDTRSVSQSRRSVGRPMHACELIDPHHGRFDWLAWPSFSESSSPTTPHRYNLGDLVKFSCTLYCLHEYVADVTAVSQPVPSTTAANVP